MPEECIPWFIGGIVVGIVFWEIGQAVARAIFNNRNTLIVVILVLLAIFGVLSLVRMVTSEECRDACTPNISGISAPTAQP